MNSVAGDPELNLVSVPMSKLEDGNDFRLALERGTAAELAHTPDAKLAAHLPGLTVQAEGPAQIATALSWLYPEPLTVLGFQAQPFAAANELVGIDARFELAAGALEPAGAPGAAGAAGGGVSRRSHWLQLEGGRVRNHLILPEHPSYAVPEAPEPGPGLERLLARATQRELVPGGYSGARIERAVLPRGEVLYVKYVSAAGDWHMRVTNDRGREALLWLDGYLGQLPASCGHAIVLAESAGDGWAIVTRQLPTRRRALSRASLKTHLSALRDLHAAFSARPPVVAASLQSRLALWWPDTLAAERHGVDSQPKAAERGWATLEARAGTDTAALVRRVVHGATTIVGQLEEAGVTFLHGDAHPNNSARQRNRTVLVDWALACSGPPEVELAWLANFEHLYAFPAQAVVDDALAGGAREPLLKLALAAHAAGIIPASCAGFDYPNPAHREVSRKKIAWWSRALADAADLLP